MKRKACLKKTLWSLRSHEGLFLNSELTNLKEVWKEFYKEVRQNQGWDRKKNNRGTNLSPGNFHPNHRKSS